MKKAPPRTNPCCLPNAKGLTYLKIGSKKHLVGMQNLGIVFQQLYFLGRRPKEVSDSELVNMTRKFNYIAHKPEIESDYAVALRKTYARYFTDQEKQCEEQLS